MKRLRQIVHLDSYEVEKGTQFGNWMRQNASITMEFTTEETVGINKILGLDIAQMPDSYDIQYVKIVQARKHKKKRINKKWLKRYGYKQEYQFLAGKYGKTLVDSKIQRASQYKNTYNYATIKKWCEEDAQKRKRSIKFNNFSQREVADFDALESDLIDNTIVQDCSLSDGG